jgi:DNA polymerase
MSRTGSAHGARVPAIMLPVADFETVSFAGFLWDATEGKWSSLPGFSSQKRGLGAVGIRVYVEHPTFCPQLFAYDLMPQYGGAFAVQWEYGQTFDVLAPLFEHIERGGLIESHNAEFEREVWNYFCVPQWHWPRLPIKQQRCSAVKCRAAGYPGKLADVTEVLNTPIKKDKDGDRLMKLFSIPRNPTKKDSRVLTLPHEAPAEWARYKSYNLTDIRSEYQVSERVPELPPDEQRRWFLDQEINDRGMAVDRQGIKDCIAVVEQAYAKYGAEFRTLTGGIEPTELQQLKGWLSAKGVDVPEMTEKWVALHVDRLRADPFATSDNEKQCLRALEIRQMLGSASVKKLYALDAQTASDGRVHGMYMMHATHHGRTGGYGPQPANLYKGEWHTPEEVDAALKVLATRSLAAVEAAYPKLGALEVVNNCLRSLFVAGPGMQLVSSDYSAIEGVVLAALAGETWVLDVFRGHGMIYEAQISRMTGVPFEEFVRHKRETGKHHPLRQQGKLAVLSGGYASWINGWKKFGADEYYESDAAIKAAILSYRDSVPAIVEFWGGQTRNKFKWNERQELYGLEGAAIKAVQNPGQCYQVGLIRFQMGSDDTLYMVLPSGRFIQYHTPRLTAATRDYASPWELALSYWGMNSNPEKGAPGWQQMDLYGGVLTQNATGGTARDIMMHGMENLDRAGYPIVMHTYDEAVAEIPARCDPGLGPDDYVRHFEACLNDLPDYARDWPIKAKGGWRGPRYGKWD